MIIYQVASYVESAFTSQFEHFPARSAAERHARMINRDYKQRRADYMLKQSRHQAADPPGPDPDARVRALDVPQRKGELIEWLDAHYGEQTT